MNSANLVICCFLKTHEKYGTAYTNLYGVEIEIKKKLGKMYKPKTNDKFG